MKKVAAKKKVIKKSKKAASPKKEKVEKSTEESAGQTSVLEEEKSVRYYEAVGRRKRAVARVRLFTRGEKEFLVNSKSYTQYFGAQELQLVADAALRKMKVTDKFRVFVRVFGGGLSGQAEAVRHGISRALTKFNPDFRKRLKRAGYLRRDPREKERRKFGLKKARKAPQWAKR